MIEELAAVKFQKNDTCQAYYLSGQDAGKQIFVSGQKMKTAIERGLGLSKRKSMISMLAGIYMMLAVGNIIGGVVGDVLSQSISFEHFKTKTYDLTYSPGYAMKGNREKTLNMEDPEMRRKSWRWSRFRCL